MMSVASNTNAKRYITVVLGVVAVLIVFPTWANTTQGINQIATVSPVVSTLSNQSNQDLSELWRRLKERFSWIFTDAGALIGWNVLPPSDSSLRKIDVTQWIWVKPEMVVQDSFIDIESDPYWSYIKRLAAYGVLSPADKFFPQNYFRKDDFMVLLAKLYKQPLSQNILWLVPVDGFMTKWMLKQIMYTLSGVEVVDIDGNPYDKLMRDEWAYYLVRMFDIPALLPDWMVAVSDWDWDGFSDIADYPFAGAINTLASLDIINTQSHKFYPDNYLRHYDFVILFVNSFLTSRDQSLPLISSNIQFADVDNSASYFTQLIYAADRGLIDHIITSRWGQLYFNPNDFVTKDEVYHILSASTNIQFIHNDQDAKQEKISRGELAKLLVDTFQFQEKNVSSDSLSWVQTDMDPVTVLKKLKILLSML